MELKVEMTKEDEKLLRECYKDAILYRAFPLVTAFTVINYALFKRGQIRQFQLIASLPVAAMAGGLFGIASYVPECRRRFASPDLNSDFSRLFSHRISAKDLIEEREQSKRLHQATHDEGPESYLKELGHGEAQNTTEDRKKNITYEELRRRNRSQYKPQPPPRSQPHDDDGWNNEVTPRPPPSPKSYLDTKNAKKNKYGDIMD